MRRIQLANVFRAVYEPLASFRHFLVVVLAILCKTLRPSCFMLDWQLARRALSLARAKAGNKMAAKMAMMAMTTKSSINVNAELRGLSTGTIECSHKDSPGFHWQRSVTRCL